MTLIPIQVAFRGFPHSDALESDIREHVAWLEQFSANIVRCRVVVELPHRHQQSGRHFHVRIELTVPGGAPIIVSHEPSLHGPVKDVEEPEHRKETEIESVRRYAAVAVHEAFHAARRQLQDAVREQRGAVKGHELPAHGVVTTISEAGGFGFIHADEREIYFSRASVLDEAFDELVVGAQVAFAEEEGEKGPQASTVRVLGKHHYVAP